MNKVWMVVLILIMLTGCATEQNWETVADVPVIHTIPAGEPVVHLPVDASVAVMEGEGTLYVCDGYTVILQTYPGGDLDGTLRAVTGRGKEELRQISSFRQGCKRLDCVWTGTGEGELQIGRACVLDDGNYHYVLAAMGPESAGEALQAQWQGIFESFRLAQPGEELNTDS